MATNRPKKKSKPSRKERSERSASPATKTARGAKALRRLDERFRERRFVPTASSRMVFATVVLSLSGVALGVGTYARWFRAEVLGPWEYAHYVLGLGVLLLVGYFALTRDMPRVVRVGELGVALETPSSGLERIAWHQIRAVRLRGREMLLELAARNLGLSLEEHGLAARRVLAEAGSRIPSRVALGSADRKRVGKPGPDEGQFVRAEPPQVTGLRCTASGAELAFEQDVRLCGACAAPYDHQSVPARCAECDAALGG